MKHNLGEGEPPYNTMLKTRTKGKGKTPYNILYYNALKAKS